MKTDGHLIAAVQRNSQLPPPTERGPAIGPVASDIIVISIAAVIVGMLVIFWAVYFRKSKRRHHRSKIIETGPVPLSSLSRGNREKRRRKRKQIFPRNPTLAETGGLPAPKTPPDSQ